MTNEEIAEKRKQRRLEYLDVLLTLRDVTSKLGAANTMTKAGGGYLTSASVDSVVKTLDSVIDTMQNWAG